MFKPLCNLITFAILGYKKWFLNLSAKVQKKNVKKEGKLADQEESDEINACSIVVPVEVDGKTEEWLCLLYTSRCV